MKQRYFSFLTLLLALTILSGCGDNPQKAGPRATAEAFLMALQDGDYDLAETYCTEGSRSNLGMFKTFSGFGANPFGGGFTITREKADGDYSKVFYTTDDDEDKEKFVRLRQDGGRWEVIANKGDMTSSGGGSSSTKTNNLLGNDDDNDSDEDKQAAWENKYKSLRDGKTAREVGEAFLTAMMFNDMAEAKKYASQSSHSALDMQGLGDKSSLEDYKVVRMEEKGKYAKLIYKEKGEDEEKVLKLGKDGNGNWQVLMSKDDNN